MIKCIKYLCALNLISLANHVAATNLVNVGNTDNDTEFEQLFKWRSFRDGFEEAQKVKKPIFLLIHKPHCPSCQKLKQKCSKSVRLMDLSDRFVMIKAEMGTNTILDEKRYQPDGKYVPRILFFTFNGQFIEEAYNRHADADKEHKFFYKTPTQVIDTMLFVLKKYTNEALPAIFQHDHHQLAVELCDMDDDTFGPTLSN